MVMFLIPSFSSSFLGWLSTVRKLTYWRGLMGFYSVAYSPFPVTFSTLRLSWTRQQALFQVLFPDTAPESAFSKKSASFQCSRGLTPRPPMPFSSQMFTALKRSLHPHPSDPPQIQYLANAPRDLGLPDAALLLTQPVCS